MSEDKEFQAWLKRAAKGSGEKIDSSEVFLSIFTRNYEKDPLCALQLGIAIMLDKPIYLLVPEGIHLPENMRRLARGVEYFDPSASSSVEVAAARLVERAKEAL